MASIQSILFNRNYYTIPEAVRWLQIHNYRSYKVDVTKHYLRFRQFDPSPNKNYRIIKFNNYIKAVLEY